MMFEDQCKKTCWYPPYRHTRVTLQLLDTWMVDFGSSPAHFLLKQIVILSVWD